MSFPQSIKTVGLIYNDINKSYNSYTLLNPLNSKIIYLIDNYGEKVHEWNSSHNGIMSYLLTNGNIVRSIMTNNSNFNAGGTTGGIEILNWESEVVWEYNLDTPNKILHHDIEILPNGDILSISWK